MNRPQYRRILVLSAGAALLAATLLAATAGVVWKMREDAFTDTARNVEKINLVLAEQTARMLQGIDLVQNDLLRDIALTDFQGQERFRAVIGSQDVWHELRQRMSGVPQLDAVILLDPAGRVITTTRSYPTPEASVADRDYYIAMRDDPDLERFISAPVQSRITNEWTIYLVRRVKARDGHFLGFMVGAIALAKFEDFYQQIYLGDDVAVSMWRNDGTLLARYPQASALTGRPSPGALKNLTGIVGGHNRIAGTGRVVGAVANQPLLLTVRRVPGYPLFTTISVPESSVLSRWREAIAPIVGGSILISIAIGLIAWLLLRQFAAQRRAAEAQTERDEANAALLQVEAMSRAKSEFLAHMSHELRTPLNAIIGFAEIMRDEMMGKLGAPQYKGYAQDIYVSGKNLLAIVSDVLDFSQVSAGRLKVEHNTVDLAGIIESVSSMFRVVVDKAGLSYATGVEPGLPAVIGDEKRIKQVLINLVGNAIKFTPGGGAVRVDARSNGTRVELRVTDTGIGISAENLAKVFEPFGFVDVPLLAQKNRGAGLGLPICKQLVELLGGTLKLESKPDKGTTAIVTLPIVTQPTALASAAE
jgi:signal transduction histidine kinase